MDDALDGVLNAVGPRLRALRQLRDTTLADLAAATGISVSTLSSEVRTTLGTHRGSLARIQRSHRQRCAARRTAF